MNNLPTAEELKQLPLRALVAFTVRCARRVQRLYRLRADYPDLILCTGAVDASIRLAEDFARGGKIESQLAREVENRVVDAVVAARLGAKNGELSTLAANAAYAAVNSTIFALESQASTPPGPTANLAVASAVVAAESAVTAGESVEPLWNDWELLHRLDLGSYPAIGDPIDASERGAMGPLFPDCSRQPAGAPTAESPHSPDDASVESAWVQIRQQRNQLSKEISHFRADRAKWFAKRKEFETQLKQQFDVLKAEREIVRRDKALWHRGREDFKAEFERQLEELDHRSEQFETDGSARRLDAVAVDTVSIPPRSQLLCKAQGLWKKLLR